MSVANAGGTYIPPRSVNYGWIGESWSLFTQELSPWIISQILYWVAGMAVGFAVSLIFSIVSGGGLSAIWSSNYSTTSTGITDASAISTGVSYVTGLAINVFQASSYYRMAVKQVRGEPITLGDAFSGASGYWHMLLAYLLVGLLSGVGLLGCVIGIFFVAGLMLPALAMVADGESAPSAIVRSLGAMKGDWVNAGLLCILFSAIYLASMIPCFTGLLATTPMAYLIAALAYRDMVGMPVRQAIVDYGAAQPGVWPPPPTMSPPPISPNDSNRPEGSQDTL